MSTPVYVVSSDGKGKAPAFPARTSTDSSETGWLTGRVAGQLLKPHEQGGGLRDRFGLHASPPESVTPRNHGALIEANLRAGMESGQPTSMSKNSRKSGATQSLQVAHKTLLTESIVGEGSRIHQKGLDELNNVTNSLLTALVQMTDRDKAYALQLRDRHAEATAPMTNSYANYELMDTSCGSSQKESASIGELALGAAHKLKELEAALAALWKDFEQAQKDVERAYHVLTEPSSKASSQSDDTNMLRTETAKLFEAFETTSGQLIAGVRNYENDTAKEIQAEMAKMARSVFLDD